MAVIVEFSLYTKVAPDTKLAMKLRMSQSLFHCGLRPTPRHLHWKRHFLSNIIARARCPNTFWFSSGPYGRLYGHTCLLKGAGGGGIESCAMISSMCTSSTNCPFFALMSISLPDASLRMYDRPFANTTVHPDSTISC